MERTGLKPIDELVILAKGGNGLAFTALWDRHIDQMKVYLRNRFRGTDDYWIDDICIRSFEKAFRQIQTYDESKSQFQTWLNTIARNTALDSLEQDSRIHPKSRIIYIDEDPEKSGIGGIPDSSKDALSSMITLEDEEEKLKYIERLPALYREVARRRMVDEMKYSDIAESMDIELNTVKTRIRRAKQLMDRMRDDDEKEERI